MATCPKVACLFYFITLLVISFFEEICCETGVPHIMKVKRSSTSTGELEKETYHMFVREQGSHFKEKITFDKKKKTVMNYVPAHNGISETYFLEDFNVNVTVIRFPGKGVCYVKPRTLAQPSMDRLWKSMDLVLRGKRKIVNVTRVESSEWMPIGRANVSKLTGNIIEFCRGLPIHVIGKVDQDGVKISKGSSRIKRKFPTSIFPFCKDPYTGYPHLSKCHKQNYKTKCSVPTHSCVRWVTCDGGFKKTATGCTVDHQRVNVVCCDLYCP